MARFQGVREWRERSENGACSCKPHGKEAPGPLGVAPQVMDQWRRLINRAPGTAVAAKEKARWAASGLGRHATA
jgi:hypothetical protein